MRFFSSFAVLTLAAVCALAPPPAAALAIPGTNAARMSRGLPPKSPIFKKRGSRAYAPPAKRSNAPVCIAIDGGCAGLADRSCCAFTACVNIGDGTPVFRCL